VVCGTTKTSASSVWDAPRMRCMGVRGLHSLTPAVPVGSGQAPKDAVSVLQKFYYI